MGAVMGVVLSRDTADGREFFAGLTPDNEIATAATIFQAFEFADQASALICVRFLDANELHGFGTSEIAARGMSRPLRQQMKPRQKTRMGGRP